MLSPRCSILAAGLATMLGCIDGPTGPPTGFVDAGGRCFFRREWVCAEGLWCGYERCRPTCGADADCPPPGVCVPDLNRDEWSDLPYDPAIRVCLLADEVPCVDATNPCPEGLYCVGEVCREGCTTAFPCRDGLDCVDQVCVPSAAGGGGDRG